MALCAACLAAAVGCAGPAGSTAAGAAGAAGAVPDGGAAGRQPAVRTGLDVLVGDGAAILHGRRVGLLTNHTGVDARGRSGIDLLHEHPDVPLVALFSPEHGIAGRAEAGERVASSRDARTGLPVHSLYGETREPTAEMLAGIDVLVFDIQDIGTRYYTYIWTMALAMHAAARHGVEFVVLDRPNPIGGEALQGNVLDPAFATFVGRYPVPMRHGLTAGELARMLNAEHGFGAELTVVPMAGWRRADWYDETGLAWIPPSPNMPSLESAAHYAGTCLFEGTNLSVGRGTPAAFQQIGAPWLDAAAVVADVERAGLAGVRVEATSFTPRSPGDGKYGDETIPGIRFVVTDRRAYDPARTGIVLLAALRARHPDRLVFHQQHFDRLAGTDRVRLMLLADEPHDRITADWAAQLAAFQSVRSRYLLYP